MAKSNRSKPRSSEKPRRSSAAPDDFRGFSLQGTRFLFHLLQSDPDDVVCLEVFEDVGVEKQTGDRLAEQDKSNRATNPLTDRSVELWKTLANWVRASQIGDLEPARTRFVIHTSHPASGKFLQSFHDAQTIDDALLALRNVRATLLDPERPLAETLRPHVKEVFSVDERLVATILSRMTFSSGLGDPNGELRPLFLRRLMSEDVVADAMRWAHGWVKEQLDVLLNKGLPARVEQAVFHKALLNFVRAHDRIAILRSVATDPTSTEVEAEIRLRVYVRQLRLIEAEEVDVFEAVNDFLRAAIDRTAWAEEGLIATPALTTFATDLGRTWRNKKDAVAIGHADKVPHLRGRLLYRDCIQHIAKLDGLDVPEHFIRGSWHALAEDRDIGWHPDYKQHLDQSSADGAWPEDVACHS